HGCLLWCSAARLTTRYRDDERHRPNRHDRLFRGHVLTTRAHHRPTLAACRAVNHTLHDGGATLGPAVLLPPASRGLAHQQVPIGTLLGRSGPRSERARTRTRSRPQLDRRQERPLAEICWWEQHLVAQ